MNPHFNSFDEINFDKLLNIAPMLDIIIYKGAYLDICNSYNMGKRDLPDIYAQARGRRHIYQVNPECPCYN